jgi:hypothetical protein
MEGIEGERSRLDFGRDFLRVSIICKIAEYASQGKNTVDFIKIGMKWTDKMCCLARNGL